MSSNKEEILDRCYLTFEDFFNDRYKRSEEFVQDRNLLDIEFHFNKPGFDLAIIILHKSLLPTISKFQEPLQTKYGFTTHVIYLPDPSRLKYCIRDLKLHEILYVIVLSENSIADDDYDVYILSDIIELQRKMKYDEVVTIIWEDWTNYSNELRRLMNNPERSPHVDNTYTKGFVPPSTNIRYLLCLLADSRKLEIEELQFLKEFVKIRKEALIDMGNAPINYGLNDRPTPSYRQEKMKYYIYEYTSNSVLSEVPRLNNTENNFMSDDNSIMSTDSNDSNVSVASVTHIPNVPSLTSAFNTHALIVASPKLYNSKNIVSISQTTKSHTPNQPVVNVSNSKSNQMPNVFIQSLRKTSLPNVKRIEPIPNKPLQICNIPLPDQNINSKVVLSTTADTLLDNGIENLFVAVAKKKIQFSLNSIRKPLTHSNVLHKHLSANIGIKVQEKSKDKSHDFTTVNPSQLSKDVIPNAEPMVYELSPVSSESSEKLSWKNVAYLQLSPISPPTPSRLEKDNKIEIDLTDDIEELPLTPEKQCTQNSLENIIQKPSQPAFYLIDLSSEFPNVKPKISLSCNVLSNLFKFILNASPLPLPSHSEVLQLLKTCLVDMEKYVASSGLGKIVVDMRACRSGGCQDIIRIIESSFGETFSGKYNFIPDLNYMWMYFPRNLSPDNVNIAFYKVMKMLELTKNSKSSNDILEMMLEKLERVVNYDFQFSYDIPFNILNYFPSLFKEYYNLSRELHILNTSLPPPEPTSASLKIDLDQIFLDYKIKFVVGPLMEYFIKVINSIHYQLDIQTMEDVFVSFRTLRFCMRKICNRLLPDQIPELVPFSITDDIMARTLELLDEINFVIREVGIMNCILFTKKHYDFINLVLDFSIKIDKCVTDGTEADTCSMDLECLIDLDPTQFLNDFSTNIKTAIYPYHHHTEIEFFKRSLKSRWIEILHQAFKGIAPEPDGTRMSKEILYLLPKNWGKYTFDEAVIEAANLSYVDWNGMLDNDFTTARLLYSDVRNNYLMWLSNNNLDHKKAMELMTQFQKKLDTKILLKQ